jgi:hypothetical protein
MTGGGAIAVLLVVLLTELHLFAVARNRRVARRREMLAPLMASLLLAFAVVVTVTIGEAAGAR